MPEGTCGRICFEDLKDPPADALIPSRLFRADPGLHKREQAKIRESQPSRVAAVTPVPFISVATVRGGPAHPTETPGTGQPDPETAPGPGVSARRRPGAHLASRC